MIRTYQQEVAIKGAARQTYKMALAGSGSASSSTSRNAITLIFPGQDSATRKVYKVALGVPTISAGQKVSVERVGSTYIVTGLV